MNWHEITKKAIKKGKPGYAQMKHQGGLVSWHPLIRVKKPKLRTFTGGPTSWRVQDARAKFIDKWAKGNARVTPNTFSAEDIGRRARQWYHGRGPHIRRGHKNPEFAKKIMELITELD